MTTHAASRRERLTGFFEDENYRTGFVFILGLNALLITLFYNKGWIPNDDGWYGHVARIIEKGGVFPRDVEEPHPGYIHFVHAAAMRLFGPTLVAMRIPLMALMAIQSIGVYLLFRRTGWVVAVTAASVMSSLGALEIVNPTPSLYAEAFGIAGVAILVNVSVASRYRLLSLGLVLGFSFMFRQLTAVFLVFGSGVFLFTENQVDRKDASGDEDFVAGWRTQWAPKGAIAIMGLATLGYLWINGTKFAWLLFGAGPVLVLLWAFKSVTITSRRFLTMMTQIASGALLSTTPIVAYLLYHQSLGLWLNDTFVRAFKVINVENTGVGASFWSDYVVHAFTNLMVGSATRKVNSIYWFFLFACSLILAIALLKRLMAIFANAQQEGRFAGLQREYALPIVAVFYAQVTIISEVPYYLYLSVGFTIIASLWIWKQLPPLTKSNSDASQARLKRIHIGFIWFAICVALIFHAGQPFTRNNFAQVSGVRFEQVEAKTPNLGLWIPPWTDQYFLEVIDVIHANSEPDDYLLAIPSNAEIYVVTDRGNPYRHFNTTLSIQTDEEVAAFYAEFEESTPTIIAHDTTNIYNAGRTPELLAHITKDFELIDSINQLDIYKYRGD